MRTGISRFLDPRYMATFLNNTASMRRGVGWQAGAARRSTLTIRQGGELGTSNGGVTQALSSKGG